MLILYNTGIVGGFAPPNTTSVATVTSAPDGGAPSVLIQTTKKDTHRRIADAPTKEGKISASEVGEVDKLVAEVEGLLRDLPTEGPAAQADLYGQDIGLMFMTDNVEWVNAAPEGCGGGVSDMAVTDEQKEKFKKAVALVEQLAALGQVDTA